METFKEKMAYNLINIAFSTAVTTLRGRAKKEEWSNEAFCEGIDSMISFKEILENNVFVALNEERQKQEHERMVLLNELRKTVKTGQTIESENL